jgi:hypothetical protein
LKQNVYKDGKDSDLSCQNKGKVIFWDRDKKQWLPMSSRNSEVHEISVNHDVKQLMQLSGMQEPLQKVESMNSGYAYNIYDSYYHNHQDSDGKERIIKKIAESEGLEIEEEDNQKYQSDINDYQDAVTGINNYQMTSAILYDLANRSNSLPIYDSRLYVGKSMIPNPRLKKRQNRSKMSNWEEEQE